METTLQRIEPSWISYLFLRSSYAKRHLPYPPPSLESFLHSKFFLPATVCDTIEIRRSVKTVDRFITRKTNDIVTVYIVAVIDIGRNMENCSRKTYWSSFHNKDQSFLYSKIYRGDWNAHFSYDISSLSLKIYEINIKMSIFVSTLIVHKI